MKNRLLFILFFTVSISLFSQKITFFGTVKDSLQTPMPYANVIAKPKDVSRNLKFAITLLPNTNNARALEWRPGCADLTDERIFVERKITGRYRKGRKRKTRQAATHSTQSPGAGPPADRSNSASPQ